MCHVISTDLGPQFVGRRVELRHVRRRVRERRLELRAPRRSRGALGARRVALGRRVPRERVRPPLLARGVVELRAQRVDFGLTRTSSAFGGEC